MEDAELFAQERISLGLARGLRLRPKSFRVVHRPFAGLRSVIYDRGDHFEVRLSELVREAPPEARASLARVLIGNLERRLRATGPERAAYLAWARSPGVAAQHDRLRGTRGRKRMAPPRGQAHDLGAIFERLNRDYFAGRLTKPSLGWTLRPSRSLYGHQDPAHNAIVINRRLDHPRVPEAVVADILHHEMVHLDLGVARGQDERRVIHGPAFRAAERRFAHHEEAQGWLRRLEQGRVRLRTPRPPAGPQSVRGRLAAVLERLASLTPDGKGWALRRRS